ncbi:hypothetical protein AMTR_s00002p00203060 [Amborella trichopoda]|uniref:Uncharacterized protein n=1 Tax=Amborella trichopoda TaxID=13333 RepID=W1P0G7_AMBTC|nr:hypothetical protein AMTR_s00002p00203060 [Amborella trichopoda]
MNPNGTKAVRTQPPIPRAHSEPTISKNTPTRLRRVRVSNRPPKLTEAGLKELNRKNDPSPYYHGLTDSGLDISRLRQAGSSPSRASHGSSSTSSSFSTVFLKLQELGSSCFTAKAKGRKGRKLGANEEKPLREKDFKAVHNVKERESVTVEKVQMIGKIVVKGGVLGEEEPLRESDLTEVHDVKERESVMVEKAQIIEKIVEKGKVLGEEAEERQKEKRP